ncbi:MAG: hypothetical protein ACXAB2_14320 [Candidatus Hodarchaeales archaeon]|jgi:hypothetical protein
MGRIKHFKPTKVWAVKFLPLFIWVSVILIKISLGMADPTLPPPTPPGGNG